MTTKLLVEHSLLNVTTAYQTGISSKTSNIRDQYTKQNTWIKLQTKPFASRNISPFRNI